MASSTSLFAVVGGNLLSIAGLLPGRSCWCYWQQDFTIAAVGKHVVEGWAVASCLSYSGTFGRAD